MITNAFNKVRGVWRFDGSLEDDLAGKDFEIETSNPTYGNFTLFNLRTNKNITRQGLKFKSGVSFNAGSDFDFSTGGYKSLVMFWWYSPSALGQTRHSITRKSTPLVAPIIAKANSTTSGGIETITNGEWVINEVGVSSTRNAIQVGICENGTNITHIYTSESYAPGLHHIAFLYWRNSSDADFIILFIDGKPGVYNVGPTSITPAASTPIRLNDVSFGYTAHKTEQVDGIIGDLIALNYGELQATTLPLKMMRFGVDHVADANKVLDNPTFNGFAFEQSSTVTTNQVFKVGENIIAARSDGEILSGSRPIWDTVYNFKNPDDISKITTSQIESCPPVEGKSSVCWTEDGLRIQSATIRI